MTVIKRPIPFTCWTIGCSHLVWLAFRKQKRHEHDRTRCRVCDLTGKSPSYMGQCPLRRD
jgi:hypothetical protein